MAANGMITPFVPKKTRSYNGKPAISYGLTSYGYDMRLAPEFKVFTNVFNTLVDPKAMNSNAFVDMTGDYCDIPPNSFVLGRSIEHFSIPSDVVSLCLGKSTMARCGLIVNVTPLEPGWRGYVVIEISNTSPLPARVYAHEGIAQVMFFQNDPCRTPYGNGKYQDQLAEITTARV